MEHGEMTMYCKLFIHSDTSEEVISVLEERFGSYERQLSTYTFKEFEARIFVNKEGDVNRIHIYPDGFLYYKYIAELEIYTDNYIRITDCILRLLWKRKMATVAVNDYEDELNDYVLNQ